MADKKGKGGKKSKDSSGSTMLIVIILAAVLVLGGGGAAAFLLMGDKGSSQQQRGENNGAWTERQGVDPNTGKRADAIYYKIKPTLMIKIIEQRRNIKKTRYLQVDVAVMARDQVVIDAVQLHRPLIVNDLIAMFSSAKYSSLLTVKGKRRLQKQGKKMINEILRREEKFTGVKAVLFTNFMVQ